MRQIAMTDIHGCRKTFESLLKKVALNPADELYLLGDYIDRGPDSKGVIEHILHLKNEGYQVKCLMGNHEAMFLQLAAEAPGSPLDFYPGLVDTLASYGCRHPREIPAEHLDFLKSLEYYLETDGYLMVHAGLNFDVPDPLLDRTAMLWERYWYNKVNKRWLQGRVVLHGHTPTKVDDILRMYASVRELAALNLDSGCVFRLNGMNQLTAFDMTNKRLYFQRNVD